MVVLVGPALYSVGIATSGSVGRLGDKMGEVLTHGTSEHQFLQLDQPGKRHWIVLQGQQRQR